MKETQSKILTETALVAELQRLGYSSVSVRTIQEWRAQKSRGYHATISIAGLVSAQDGSLDTISGRSRPSPR